MNEAPTTLPGRRPFRRAGALLLAGLAAALVIGTVFGWLARYSPETPPSARAVRGVLDLRGIDLNKRIVTLDGEWALDRERFVAPGDFAAEATTREFLSLPQNWNNGSPNRFPAGKTGYGTLRLRILLDRPAVPLALRLDYILSAYKLWANGRLVAQTGIPATNADGERPEQAIRLAVLPGAKKATEIDLVLQASTFHSGWGSIRSLRLGPADTLWNWQNGRWNALYFVAGALMLMGIYHLTLYLLRRRERAALYFGLYALLWMTIFLSLETDWAIRQVAPGLSADLLFHIYRASMILAIPLGYQFMRALYPQEFPRWLGIAFWSLACIHLALLMLLPTGDFVALLPTVHLASAARVLYSVGGLIVAVRRGRDGAATILVGYGIFGVLGVNDMLNDMNVINTAYVMHFGILALMIAQALALAARFSRLFETVRLLSETVSDKNRLLEREIGERRRAQQEIVAVSEAERSRISNELHDGLCQQLAGARLFCSAFKRKWPTGAEPKELAQLSATLDSAVNHAHNLAQGLWPAEDEDADLCRSLAALVKHHGDDSPVPIELEVGERCAECACANAGHARGIAREAIVNALKHAKASRIGVELNCRDQRQTTLTISDDGIGCQTAAPPARNGLGLRIMAYRARMIGGDFRIETGATGGTRIIATLPCRQAE